MLRRFAPDARSPWSLLACALILLAQGRAVHAQTFATWQNWLATLQSQGYTITQGSAAVFDAAYCKRGTFPVFKSCFNSDYEDPYLIPLPPVGNGMIDPYYGSATTRALPNGTVVGQSYQLDPTEAVLVVIKLPPNAAYMSYQTYMFTRSAADYQVAIRKLSPDPARAMIFGSFNNSISNTVIQQQSGIGFGQGTVGFLTTGNSALAGTLTSSFAGAGGNPATMFIDAMPPTLNFGLTAAADDFQSVLRYSVPQDAVQAGTWRTNIAANMQVYRIDPPAGLPVQLFGPATINDKSYRVSESNHQANLTELSQLLQGWLATQEPANTIKIYRAISGEKVSDTGTPLSGELGPYCIQNATNCAADSQDTDTYKTVNVGKLVQNQIFIADGVDHTVTNNATFVSLGISDQKTSTGVADVSQVNPGALNFSGGTLTGSAASVLQGLGLYSQASAKLIKDLPNLFAQIFVRSCDPPQPYCNAPYTTIISTDQVPLTDPVGFTERAYVLPGAPNGANPTDLLNPDVIH